MGDFLQLKTHKLWIFSAGAPNKLSGFIKQMVSTL